MYSGRKEAAKSESQTSKTPGKRQSFSLGFPLALEKLEKGKNERSFSSLGSVRELKHFYKKVIEKSGDFWSGRENYIRK